MRFTLPSQKETSAGTDKQRDSRTTHQEEQELADADLAGVFLFGPAKVADGGEDDSADPLAMKEVQKDPTPEEIEKAMHTYEGGRHLERSHKKCDIVLTGSDIGRLQL